MVKKVKLANSGKHYAKIATAAVFNKIRSIFNFNLAGRTMQLRIFLEVSQSVLKSNTTIRARWTNGLQQKKNPKMQDQAVRLQEHLLSQSNI